MKHYDPLIAPDADEWSSLDETERLTLARAYHRRAHSRVPNLEAHIAVHAIVENQIALGDETSVRRTVTRLMAEGLDRHDAIHAIGATLLGVMHDMTKQSDTGVEVNKRYYAELEQLSAERWRQSG
jgi:hypothetical protein